jgi:fructose/tagatose bisphosphate aldolase
MSIVTAKDILLEATEGGYAVGAFSITNLIQLDGSYRRRWTKRRRSSSRPR